MELQGKERKLYLTHLIFVGQIQNEKIILNDLFSQPNSKLLDGLWSDSWVKGWMVLYEPFSGFTKETYCLMVMMTRAKTATKIQPQLRRPQKDNHNEDNHNKDNQNQNNHNKKDHNKDGHNKDSPKKQRLLCCISAILNTVWDFFFHKGKVSMLNIINLILL